jgi:hypothetical protein
VIAKPDSSPAAAISGRRGGPARSRIRTANAANASIAETACEKNSAANTIRIVPSPSVIAAAAP